MVMGIVVKFLKSSVHMLWGFGGRLASYHCGGEGKLVQQMRAFLDELRRSIGVFQDIVMLLSDFCK